MFFTIHPDNYAQLLATVLPYALVQGEVVGVVGVGAAGCLCKLIAANPADVAGWQIGR